MANNGDLRIDELIAIQAGGTLVVIAMWESPDAPPAIPCVAFDSRMAGRIATEHLFGVGHRRIGAIVASKKGGIHHGGYRDALQAAHVKHASADVRFCSDSYEGGYEAAFSLLSMRPELSALYVSNNLPAVGALNAAAALGRKVPDDLLVVNITDIAQASQSRAALRTGAIPTAEITEQGIDSLIRLIDQPESLPRVVRTSDPVLVVRASTAALPGG